MTIEEAIKRIKAHFDKWALDNEDTKAIQTLIPELHESEDEMMIYELQGFLISFGSDYFGSGEWQKFDDWLEKQKEQKSAECEWPNLSNCIKNCKKCQGKCFYRKESYEAVERINLGNEFENQVSRILASVLNGEHEYNEGFVKYAAQSLLGYAKNEIKSSESDKIERLMKALQATNAQIGELVEENYKLKEQKPAWWSEEDLQHKSWILECLAVGERKMPEYAEDFRAAYKWLKFSVLLGSPARSK